jgi:hypothetical protein
VRGLQAPIFSIDGIVMDEVARVIGTLEAGLAAQKEQHIALAEKFDTMDGKLDQLLANQAQQRGARKLAAWLATGAGSFAGAVIGWVIEIKTR